MKVCHLTSAHPRYDTRIFLKECRSLASNGFNVSLVVADDLGHEEKEGITIYDVGQSNSGRFGRFTETTRKVYKKAIELEADIYHFHDPELMFYAYLLKLKGKKVIYDVHEDLPRQLLTKPYLNKTSKRFLSFIIEKVENFFSKRYTSIVAATPYIEDRFQHINNKTITVNNFPMHEELHDSRLNLKKKNQVCFIGGISEIRGIESLVKACEKINGRLVLAGKFNNALFEERVKKLKGWNNVDFVGFVDRDEVKRILAESKAGIVTFLEAPNHTNSQPNKMFEYMSAALPVISSNFKLWTSIIEKNECGFCVDPQNSADIAQKINILFENEKKVTMLGKNGRQSVMDRYNWKLEQQKLIDLYKLHEDNYNNRGTASVY